MNNHPDTPSLQCGAPVGNTANRYSYRATQFHVGFVFLIDYNIRNWIGTRDAYLVLYIKDDAKCLNARTVQ